MRMPDQKGERHALSHGSSQASSDQPAARRSASVCTRNGNAAGSKRGEPPCAAHAAKGGVPDCPGNPSDIGASTQT